MDKLRPLHQRLGKAKPGEWLAEHHEDGQTFDAYRASDPVIPDKKRRVLHVQPLGDLTATQRRIITRTADYMARFFNLEVRTREDLAMALIPSRARRVHPTWGDKQILSTYVLEDLLQPRLPDDAMAYIAFTASDLWPGHNWNFVFGQASLRDRVGVWSLYRNGNPDESPESFRLALLRTMKIAVHETGHMFSLPHCTAYECSMGGTNSLDESDRSPLWLCPECMAKIAWATGADPVARYRKLAEYCRAEGLTAEEAFFVQSIAALDPAAPGPSAAVDGGK
jgi:archaemetzincin